MLLFKSARFTAVLVHVPLTLSTVPVDQVNVPATLPALSSISLKIPVLDPAEKLNLPSHVPDAAVVVVDVVITVDPVNPELSVTVMVDDWLAVDEAV